MSDLTYSTGHPHEPEIPPEFDAEGRCLVCGLFVRAEHAEAECERLHVAIRGAMNELGVPDEGYLAPVAHAYQILSAALGEADDE